MLSQKLLAPFKTPMISDTPTTDYSLKSCVIISRQSPHFEGCHPRVRPHEGVENFAEGRLQPIAVRADVDMPPKQAL